MFKSLIVAAALMVSMVGVASATTPNTPYRLVGAMLIIDQRNTQVEAVGINLPAETLSVCEAAKTAIVANGFVGGNYDYRTSVQRTYNLTCVNTNVLAAP